MCGRASLAILIGLAFTLAPSRAEAQRRVERFESPAAALVLLPSPPAPLPPDTAERRSTGRLIAGGALGGVMGGAALGFIAGALACGYSPDDYCGLAAVPAALLGEVLGLAIGVNLTNGGRGSLPLGILGSLLVGVGGSAIVAGLGFGEAWVMVPVAQLGTVIAIERRTE